MDILPISVPYKYNNDIYNNRVKEFTISYDITRNNMDDLIVFLNTYPDTRINIDFGTNIDYSLLKIVNQLHKQIYVKLNVQDLNTVNKLKNLNVKFYFSMLYPVNTWTHLSELLELGVSDIYFVDDLCYNMSELSDVCHNHNVQLRLVLNHIPMTTLDKGTNPCSPFWRPQDIQELQKYVDVFEFDCGDPYDWTKFDVLCRRWFLLDHPHWDLELSEINSDVKLSNIDAGYNPAHAAYKMNCGLKCKRKTKNPCHKCDSWLEISKKLKDKGAIFEQ